MCHSQARALTLLYCDRSCRTSPQPVWDQIVPGRSDRFRGTASRLSAINEGRGALGQHLARGNTHGTDRVAFEKEEAEAIA